MYINMNAGRRRLRCPTLMQFLKFFLNTLFLVITISSVILAIIFWRKLTPCFQREVAILCCCMIYWRFARPEFPALVWELFQFLAIFWIGEAYNRADTQIEPTCLDTKGLFMLQFIKGVYRALLVAYTGSCGAFLLFFIGVVIYAFVEYYYILPRRRRRNEGLNSNEIDELEEIEFKQEVPVPDEQATCSICLEEFQHNEKIVRTPICNHYFHKPCLRQWLQAQVVCPYCRSDVKENLRILKQGRQRGGRDQSIQLANSNVEVL